MARRPQTREEAKRESREALIRAGTREFIEHGLRAPSLDAICSRAGYTRGAFYVHFKDRADFVAAVMERLIGGLIDVAIATGGEERDLDQVFERFTQMLKLVMRGGTNPIIGVETPSNGSGIRFHDFFEACARAPEVRRRLDSLLGEASERIRKIADEAKAKGSVRSDLDSEQLGIVLVGLAVGSLMCADTGIRFNADRAREALMSLLRSA
jgi:AcrR family transcriptional regulator